MWKEARNKLDQLRTLDNCFQLFGASGHRYKLGKPASVRQIKHAEAQLRCLLPEELSKFYLEMGSGGAGPYYGILPLSKLEGISANRPYPGIENIPKWKAKDSDDYFEVDMNELKGVLPVIHEGCGHRICLVTAGKLSGRMIHLSAEGYIVESSQTLLTHYHDWLDSSLRAFSYIKELLGTDHSASEIHTKILEELAMPRGKDLLMSLLGIHKPGPEPLFGLGNYQTPDWYEQQLASYRAKT